jgi:hypothetical protein
MFYKGYEIIGVATTVTYSTLEDDGRADAHITEFGERGEIYQYVYIKGSPFDIEEDYETKYNSIEECKQAIDNLGGAE